MNDGLNNRSFILRMEHFVEDEEASVWHTKVPMYLFPANTSVILGKKSEFGTKNPVATGKRQDILKLPRVFLIRWMTGDPKAGVSPLHYFLKSHSPLIITLDFVVWKWAAEKRHRACTGSNLNSEFEKASFCSFEIQNQVFICIYTDNPDCQYG